MIAPFVDSSWLAAHPEVVVADVRHYLDGRSGRLAYKAGHLPGAVFVSMDTVLAAPPSPAEGRHPLPDPAAFAEGLAKVGIGDGTTVVAYDDDAGAMAARLVWLLRILGHNAALLDGGITSWTGELTQEVPPVTPATFAPPTWPAGAFASIEEAADLRNLVVDARAAERWRGDVEPIDARPGRIPGSRNLVCRDNVGPGGGLLPDAELRARFAEVDRPWIALCGSGVTACQNLLVAEHLGLPPGRLYAGSYSQWAATDRPVEKG